MSTCTYNCFMNVINIGNSIIGVSILAMPYCFRKCGILLSIFLIFISGILTRTACYLLLKSAIMARRRNFEFLAFHTFGTTGKLAVEISVIGFLIGVCIAFFVVIGDLGPPLAAEFLYIENAPNLRSNLLVFVGLCVALPLGMLRKIDSLTSLSAFSIAFYACLILKIFSEAVPNLSANEWWYEVNWWKSEGILPCLPIFSMALSCQTQLFEFFDTSNDPSLKRMQSVVAGAVHLCSAVYIMVGTLGYIAFHDKAITGNILVFLSPSMITEAIKLGFILTVAISFPLCLFPCRSSLHSLIFKQGFGHHDTTITAIPENRFRILTVSLVIVTIGIAIMLPNIEFVLGIIGSTIGTLICLIFPAIMFIQDTSKNTTEKRMAQFLVGIGLFILIACTYSTLQEEGTHPEPVIDPVKNIIKIAEPKILATFAPVDIIKTQSSSTKVVKFLEEHKEEKPPDQNAANDQKRLEPPVPQEPEAKVELNAELDPQALQKEDKEIQKETVQASNSIDVSKKERNIEKQESILRKLEQQVELNAELDPQALQKEDKEIQKETVQASNSIDVSKKERNIEKQESILRKLEQQHKEQKLILEQQKKVLEELKLHRESHDEIRKNAVEQQLPVVPDAEKEVPAPIPKKTESLENVVKSVPEVVSVPPIKNLIPPNEPPKKENVLQPGEYVPIKNTSKEDPLKTFVLNAQNDASKILRENKQIDDALQRKSNEELILNISAPRVKKNLEDINLKFVSSPPVSVPVVAIKTTPKTVAVKSPKTDLDSGNELKFDPGHIIKRETLGKEEETTYSNIIDKDSDKGSNNKNKQESL
nr:LOW QUALITY PROTEIN: putative sodium-coupled neutral amino acid transporter 10 [Parasteatoda tepidariorum]